MKMNMGASSSCKSSGRISGARRGGEYGRGGGRLGAATAAAIAIASLLASAGIARAEQALTLQPSTGPVISAPEMAEQYARQSGVPVATALKRVETQEREHGLVEELRKSLGSRYAGVWIDADGTVRVGALGKDDDATVEAALNRRGLPSQGAIVPVTSSVEDLEAVQYELAQELRPALDIRGSRVTLDEAQNSVDVVLPSGAPAQYWAKARSAAAEFAAGREAIGPPLPPANPTPMAAAANAAKALPQPARRRRATVSVVEGPERTASRTACGPNSCSQPLRAGVRILNGPHGNGNAECSAGFVSTWWSGSQTYYFIMDAGHCVWGESYRAWSAYAYVGKVAEKPENWLPVGEVWTWRFGSAGGEPSYIPWLDASIINVAGGEYWGYEMAPWLWMHGWPNGEEWAISGQTTPVVGEIGCRSGNRSAYTCGTISATNSTVSYAAQNGEPASTVTNMMEVPGACPVQGDSGGPFVNGGTALGITSGVARSIGGCTGLYAKVNEITGWFGVTVY